MAAPCADKVGVEGKAIDGVRGNDRERTLRPARQWSTALARQGVALPSLTLWFVELDHEAGLRRQQKPRLGGRGSELSESGGESWWLLENSSRRDAGLVVRRLAQHRTAGARHHLDHAGIWGWSSDGSRST